MKKIFIVFLILIYCLFLTGCNNISYKELYLNGKIQIKDLIEEDAIHETVKEALNYLLEKNKVEVRTFSSENGVSIEKILKYDKKNKKLIFESKRTDENNNVTNEMKIYIVDGYFHEYMMYKDPENPHMKESESKIKYKLFLDDIDFERVISPYFPLIGYDFIFENYINEFGKYTYGKDEYNNIVLLFEREKELPVFKEYCQALVMEDDIPIFYIYERATIVELCEFKYNNIKMTFPNLKEYELIGTNEE